jgi:hypothetical protein
LKASVIIVGLLLGACTTVLRPESSDEESSRFVKTDRLGTRTCFTDTGKTWPDLLPRGALALELGPSLDVRPRTQDMQDLQHCWCSLALQDLKEDSLLPLSPDSEVYRFTWIPSFHASRVIRVERRGNVYSLHVKEVGKENGPLAIDRRILLTPTQWQGLQQHLEQARFWTRDRFAPHRNLVYVDGAYWLFEGGRQGRYRALDILSPEPDSNAGPFYALGVFLSELAGIPLDKDALY